MRSQARSDHCPGSLATVPINAVSCYQEVVFHFIGTAITLAGMKCHLDYLAAILRPETTQDVLDCVGDQTTVWPKIVQGRFLVKLSRKFTIWKDQFCLDTLTGPFGGLCRHLKFINVSTEKLGQEIKAAFEDYERKAVLEIQSSKEGSLVTPVLLILSWRLEQDTLNFSCGVILERECILLTSSG